MDARSDARGHESTLLAWLDARIAESAAAVTAELGDASLCRVHKDGAVTGGLKYHEGRMAAFAEARRLVAVGGGTLRDDLHSLDRRWRADLDRHRTSEAPTTPWVAYASGGVSAADEMAERLNRTG